MQQPLVFEKLAEADSRATIIARKNGKELNSAQEYRDLVKDDQRWQEAIEYEKEHNQEKKKYIEIN